MLKSPRVVTFTHTHDTEIWDQGHRQIQTTQEREKKFPISLLMQLCYWIINEDEKENDAGSRLSLSGNKS